MRAISLVAGVISATAFPPFGFLPMALLGPALLFWHARKSASGKFMGGFLYGVGLLAPQLHWLSSFHLLAPYGVILISALPYGVAARMIASKDRPSRIANVLTTAAAFTAAEMVRSVGTFALPWGVIGSLAAETRFRSLAPLIGLFGLSFLAYLLTSAVAFRAHLLAGCLVCILFVISFAPEFFMGGADITPERLENSVEGERVITVGIVQGNFSQDADFEFQPETVTDFLFESTRALGRDGAQTIFWSETVILEYLNRSSAMRDRIQALANATGSTIVLGAPGIITRVDKRNSVYIFTPDQVAAGMLDSGASRADASVMFEDAAGAIIPRRYDKHHLVPFGEFIPGLGPDLDHILLPRGTGDFSSSILPRPIGVFGHLVCYEGVFPYLSRELVREGAGCLVNLSNDAWSRSPAAAEQHASLARLRAAEFARPFIRAGNVGPSFILDASGRCLAELKAGVAGTIKADVVMSERRTVTNIMGDWIGWSCLLGLPFILTVRALLGEVVRLKND